jgi:hypothetical protein
MIVKKRKKKEKEMESKSLMVYLKELKELSAPLKEKGKRHEQEVILGVVHKLR